MPRTGLSCPCDKDCLLRAYCALCSVLSDCDPTDLARQAPLSMEFPRQVYCSGLPCPPPGDLPNPGIEPGLPHCRQILYCLSHQGSPEDLLGTTKTSDTSGSYSPTRGCFASFPSKETQILPCQVKVTACSAYRCSSLRTPRRSGSCPALAMRHFLLCLHSLSPSVSPSVLTQQMEVSVSGMNLPQWAPEPSSPPCPGPLTGLVPGSRAWSQVRSFLSSACLPASRAVTQQPRGSFPAKDRAWRCGPFACLPLGHPGEWPSTPESDGDAPGWGGGFLPTGVEGLQEGHPACWVRRRPPRKASS